MHDHIPSAEKHMDNAPHEGIEHVPDSTFVIPIIDDRTLLQLKQSLESVARQMALWEQIKGQFIKLLTDLEYLRGLAILSRYALLGDRCALTTLQLEFELLLSRPETKHKARPIATESLRASDDSGGTTPAVNLTALFDTLLAGFLIYRGNRDRYERLTRSIHSRLGAAVGMPLFYAGKAREFLGAKDATLAPEPARVALSVLVRRLCENDHAGLPLPHACDRQINRIIEFWARPNIVHAVMEMIDRNTLPIESLSSTSAEIKQQLGITLARECKLPKEDLLVLFAPAYYRAKVLKLAENTIRIEVPPAPEHSRVLVLSRPSSEALTALTRLGRSARGPARHLGYVRARDDSVQPLVISKLRR